MPTDEQQIADALQKGFDASNGGIQEINGESGLDFHTPSAEPAGEVINPAATQETPVAIPAVETGTPPSAEITPAATGDQSSLTTQKSLDELLSEKSGGKYKTWDDIEKLAAPVAPREFKSKFAQKLEEYVDAGGDEETFYATQTTDFDKMSAKELLEYKIQSEDPDMEQAEINYEMKKRYGIDKWKDNAADYEEGEEPEDVKISRIKYAREAEKARKEFKAHQSKWAVPPTKVDASVEAAKDQAAARDWDSKAREAVSQVSKVPLKLSDTETYDFTVDETEKAEIQKTINQLRVDAKSFFNPYKLADGNYDLKGIAEAMFKFRNFDKAVALAADQASKKGALAVAKEIKNSSLVPGEEKPVSVDKPLSREQQMATQLVNHFKNV